MRRMNLKITSLILSSIFLLSCSVFKGNRQNQITNTPWDTVKTILESIKAPDFPNKDFIVTDYGAVADGKTNCTDAFRKAIEDCSKQGGGRVIVPAGDYFTGPVYLRSNVNLHLKKGSRLLFSTTPEDYPMVYTRWEGIELMNYSPLIYAFEEKNIAITGQGTLDGQANNTNWWPWKGQSQYGYKKGDPSQNDKDKRAALFEMAEKNVPVSQRRFGRGFYLRPQFVQPYRCQNVLIEGVTVTNSPMWVLNPVLCVNVTIKKVTINSMGPNSDGCDPESCRNVLIKDCYFNTGDDCIAIKSGRNAEGRRINIPSENIIIQDCKMANGHGGVVIGSEISGGVRNVFAEDCEMSSPELDRALRIKTSSARGGITENIHLRNIKVGEVAEQAIIATMFYEDKGDFMPVIRNISVQNMTVEKGGKTGVLLEAYKESPIKNFKLINVKIDNAKTPYSFTNVKDAEFVDVRINGEQVSNPK